LRGFLDVVSQARTRQLVIDVVSQARTRQLVIRLTTV